jgi:hypothetical protein
MVNKILLDEYPLLVLPRLATLIGLNESIFLQQLHYWLLSKNAKNMDGKDWVFNTYSDWQKQFPFWSAKTIQRIITQLENRGLIITTTEYNTSKIDKTKWYTINYKKLEELVGESEIRQKAKENRQEKPSTEQNDLSTGQVDLSTGQVDLSTGQVDLSTGQVDLSTGQVDLSMRTSCPDKKYLCNIYNINTTETTTENNNQSVSHISNISNIREKNGNCDGRTDGFSFDMRRWELIKEQICLCDFDPEDQVIIETAITGLLSGDYDNKKPRAVIYSILEKLDALSVERALSSYQKIDYREKITNPIRYFQQCLLNSQAEEVLEKKRFALQFSGP